MTFSARDCPLRQAGGASVDGAQLLVAGPGELAVRITQHESGLQPGVPAFDQVLQAVLQQAADPVERVITMASLAELLLLHLAADLVDERGAELDGESVSSI